MRGTMNLKLHDEIIATQEYKSAVGIDHIVKRWTKIYGAGMKKAVVEVIPDDEPYERHFERGDEKLTRRLNNVRHSNTIGKLDKGAYWA